MLGHPRFKPHLRVDVMEGEGVFLISDTQRMVLQGRLYGLIAPLLDGRSIFDLCEQLRNTVPLPRVFYTLDQLESHSAARHPKSWHGLQNDPRGMSCGKGVSDVQARASALCEGLERYSSVYRGQEPRRRARLAELGEAGLDPSVRVDLKTISGYRWSSSRGASMQLFSGTPCDARIVISSQRPSSRSVSPGSSWSSIEVPTLRPAARVPG